MHPVHQWAEMREQLRLNKIYQGLRCESRPRYVFHGNISRYELEKRGRKTKAVFPPLSGNRRNGIKIPGLKTLYRPIMGGSPATYYVKNGGSDVADGLSDGNAWETLDKVNASSFLSDDIVQFNQGDTWVDRLNIPSSGTLGHPIVFQTYGTGARPLFYGLTTISGFVLHADAIYKKTDATANAQLYRHVFEDGLRLIYRGSLGTMVQGSFFHDDGADTLYIWSTDDADPDTHTIERCQDWVGIDMNGKGYLTFDGIECKGYATRGFQFTTTAGSNDIILTDCVASWNCATGFAQSGYTNTADAIVYDTCIGHDNLGENFWIGNGSDHIMRDCTSYNSGKDKILKDYDQGPLSHMAGGLVVGIKSEDVIIENNTFYDNYRHPILRIEFEDGYARPTGTIVRYNMFDASLGYATTEATTCVIDEATYTDMYYNVLIGDSSSGTLFVWDGSSYGEYYNNTIYHISGGYAFSAQDCSNITLKNNIIYSELNDEVIKIYADGQSGFASDYNCFYHEGVAASGFVWGSTGYNTLALWAAQNGTDGNSMQDDPLFLDVSGDDYRLQSGSPCIEAGTPIAGLTKDRNGIPLGRGINPDIGCHETLKGGPRRL